MALVAYRRGHLWPRGCLIDSHISALLAREITAFRCIGKSTMTIVTATGHYGQRPWLRQRLAFTSRLLDRQKPHCTARSFRKTRATCISRAACISLKTYLKLQSLGIQMLSDTIWGGTVKNIYSWCAIKKFREPKRYMGRQNVKSWK